MEKTFFAYSYKYYKILKFYVKKIVSYLLYSSILKSSSLWRQYVSFAQEDETLYFEGALLYCHV